MPNSCVRPHHSALVTTLLRLELSHSKDVAWLRLMQADKKRMDEEMDKLRQAAYIAEVSTDLGCTPVLFWCRRTAPPLPSCAITFQHICILRSLCTETRLLMVRIRWSTTASRTRNGSRRTGCATTGACVLKPIKRRLLALVVEKQNKSHPLFLRDALGSVCMSCHPSACILDSRERTECKSLLSPPHAGTFERLNVCTPLRHARLPAHGLNPAVFAMP